MELCPAFTRRINVVHARRRRDTWKVFHKGPYVFCVIGRKGLDGNQVGECGKKRYGFSILYLNRHPASAPVAQEGTVVRRRRELEIEVDLAGTRIRVPYDLGGVLPGMKVAVTEHITPSGQRKKIVPRDYKSKCVNECEETAGRFHNTGDRDVDGESDGTE